MAQTNEKDELKATAEDTMEKPPPLYGSQEYWEERYQKQKQPDSLATDATESNNGPDAAHSWYFSFEELKPIILPLILGRQEEEEEEDREEGDEEDEEDDDEKEEGEVAENEGEEDDSRKPEEQVPRQKSGKYPDGKESAAIEEKSTTENGKGAEKEEEDEWEEVQEGNDKDDDDDDEEEEEEAQPQLALEGLAANGPISVLEVGCGDVPLGTGLAEELQSMQSATGANVLDICQRIVCTDYSPTVIDEMKRSLDKKRKQRDPDDSSATTTTTTTTTTTAATKHNGTIPIEFQVADARKLPFDTGGFHLILEKGTMDAMISDAQVGVSNCIQIVTDCARVLAVGGCLLVVSHINAHTNKGQEWLEQVVLVGLRKGDAGAHWAIEVHGCDDRGPEKGDEEDNNAVDESPGPAVYLLFKRKPQEEEDSTTKNNSDKNDPPTVPLHFFNY